MNIYLIRHAESFPADLEKVWQGVHNDVDLTSIGYEQAKNLVSLIDTPITKIFSSPMKRALQTAGPLSAYTRIPIIISQDILEIDLGNFENLTTAQIRESYPKELQQVEMSLDADFYFPNGGCFSDLAVRVSAFADKLRKSDENTAVFSHNYALQMLIAVLTERLNSKMPNSKLKNAAVTRLHSENQRFIVDYINRTGAQ